MSIENIAIFKALGAKMQYLSQRQGIISQNIANADTPGYRPQDLKPVDFNAVLKDVTAGDKSGTASNGATSPHLTMASTKPNHLPAAGEIAKAESAKQKTVYEVAPAGNAVIMEEQLINSNQVMMDYNLMASLYQKNVRLMQMALGGQ